MCTTIDDVIFYNTKTIVDDKGNLTPIEQSKDIPFDIKRVFYVYGVRGEAIRGKHAHHDTKQIIICLRGQIDIICTDGINEVRYLLESPQQAVLIPELIWDEQIYRSEDSILLSICSSYYEKKDYITDFEEFKRIKGVN